MLQQKWACFPVTKPTLKQVIISFPLPVSCVLKAVVTEKHKASRYRWFPSKWLFHIEPTFSQLRSMIVLLDTNFMYFYTRLSGSTISVYSGEKNVGSMWGGRDGDELKTTDDQVVLVSWVTVTWQTAITGVLRSICTYLLCQVYFLITFSSLKLIPLTAQSCFLFTV